MSKHDIFIGRFGFGLEDLVEGDLETGRKLYQQYVRKQNYFDQEGFCLWYSHSFCESPSSGLQLNQELLMERFTNFEEQKGDYALIWSLDFPKYYDREILKEVLDKEIGLGKIKMATLCGSKKPYSDIDLFVVGDVQSYGNGYLDIYGLDYVKFRYFASNLDFSVTTGLFGMPVIGHEEIAYWRNFVLNEPINELMVMHNLNRAGGEAKVLQQFQKDSRDYETSMGYVFSYRRCAEELRNGKKILTLDNLGGKENIQNMLRGD